MEPTPKSKTKPRIVVVCGDTGGAEALAPVLEVLRSQKWVEIRALATRIAQAAWSRWNLPCELLPNTISEPFALNRLGKAALLLTGTSSSPVDCEKRFIATARATGVPSLTVLDFWSNYAERFSDETGQLVFLPDQIAVMDPWARDEMIAAGIGPERIVVTGQPAFDELKLIRREFTATRRRMIRTALHVHSDTLLILFVSQPLSALFGDQPESPRFPGYDERTVLRSIISALEELAIRRERSIALVVRLHPKEQTEWLEKMTSRHIQISWVQEQSPREWMMATDLVVGMTSTVLVEACYLGCVTASLQPNLKAPDISPLSRWGVGCTVRRMEEIKPTLTSLLFDEAARAGMRARLSKLQFDGNATHHVVDLVEGLLEKRRTREKAE